MNRFFKSFILTIIFHNLLLGMFFAFTITQALEANSAAFDGYLTPLLIMVSIFSALDLILMFVIALPFFLIVRKHVNFSWIYGLIMGLVMGGAVGLVLRLLSPTYNHYQFVGSLILYFIFGLIFIAIYFSLKEQKKPTLAKADEIFS